MEKNKRTLIVSFGVIGIVSAVLLWGVLGWSSSQSSALAADSPTTATSSPLLIASNVTSTIGLDVNFAWKPTDNDSTTAIAFGDVDNDGDLDLAIANYGQVNKIHYNDGTMLASSVGWESIDIAETTGLAWADADGDGDIDLAVSNYNASDKIYYNQNGVLDTSPGWASNDTGRAVESNALAWGDIDSDGDYDLIVAKDGVNHLYRNNGQTGISTTPDLTFGDTNEQTLFVALADIDGNGLLDVAVSGQTYDGNFYSFATNLYFNTGGTFGPNSQRQIAETGGLAWGDLDGDGYPDLSIGSKVYLNPNGLFPTSSPDWEASSSSSGRTAWGDVDGDGDLDLAIGDFWSEGNRVYLNEWGMLNTEPAWVSAKGSTDIAWADIDGDSDLDLAIGNNLGPNKVFLNLGIGLPLLPDQEIPHDVSYPAIRLGDVDNDGDLDLASGDDVRVWYRNNNGVFATTPAWTAADTNDTQDVQWADINGDGRLDLVVGNGFQSGEANKVYLNLGSTLGTNASWSSTEQDHTWAVAVGDVDGDGDLDVAAGNASATTDGPGAVNRLYLNLDGALETTATWASDESDETLSLAWGDVDGDGDLDLAVGNVFYNKMYLNQNGTLETTASWVSNNSESTYEVLWGDVDGDGDLDLFTGNAYGENKVYYNQNGQLDTVPGWTSGDNDDTRAMAIGDLNGDGRLDLVAGNNFDPSVAYFNHGGTLNFPPRWSAQGYFETVQSIALGDIDSDGDVDVVLAEENAIKIYENQKPAPLLNPDAFPATLRIELQSSETAQTFSGGTTTALAPAEGYAVAGVREDGTIPFTFILNHPEGLPVREVRGYYSLDGGGKWLEAVPASGSDTVNLATAPALSVSAANTHTYVWDVFASGFFGQSDNVVFRLEAIPDLTPVTDAVALPFQIGKFAGNTYPFRVRGNQVRVYQDSIALENTAENAEVYRLAAGQSVAEAYRDQTDVLFRTNGQGYLQGRGQLSLGDSLAALVPITHTNTYTLYHTNIPISGAGATLTPVTEVGVQNLVARSTQPLYRFNVDVSLEWDARQDSAYLAELNSNLMRTSELLYDWSNGQAALGRVRVYHARERWVDAHIRVYASNRLRPNADQGGHIETILTEANPLAATGVITYTPGQTRMPPTWNRFGETGGSQGEDWPRALAHELGHYLFFLDDNYLGLDENGGLITVPTCPGAMADPYSGDDSAGYDEFTPAGTIWDTNCAQTLSEQLTGRSDWETITTFFPTLRSAVEGAAITGPESIPVLLTDIQFQTPVTPSVSLEIPLFYLFNSDGGRYFPTNRARALLFQNDRLVDLGAPNRDQVDARGAAAGDRLCLFDTANDRVGCSVLDGVSEQLIVNPQTWNPEIIVTPVNSRTIEISVAQGELSTGDTLQARVYSSNDPAGAAVNLPWNGTRQAFFNSVSLEQPAFTAAVHVWVDEADPRRELVTDYTLGGNPVQIRGRNVQIRGRNVQIRGRNAPVISGDGQVIVYGRGLSNFPQGEFYAIQTVSSVPAPPVWTTTVGQAYRLTKSARAPNLEDTTITLSFQRKNVPAGELNFLRVYFHDGTAWQELDTALDVDENVAAAPTQGVGLYMLMSTISVGLDGPGWNLFAYPVQATRNVDDALLSISGHYTTVYSYDTTDTADPWKMYDVTSPDWANDLAALEFGKGYWINVDGDVVLKLKGAGSTRLGTSGIAAFPPSTFYGMMLGSGYTAGMAVEAVVDGVVCGTGTTFTTQGALVYTLNVRGHDLNGGTTCGSNGEAVVFRVDGTLMLQTAMWNNQRVQRVNLSETAFSHTVYLPLVIR